MRISGARMLGFYALVAQSLLVSCGNPQPSRTASLTEGRAYWEEIAPTCAGYPAKAECGDGDMVLFGGLLCASGDERGCRLVRDAQDAHGQWWRSPRRNPGNLGEKHAFSRDMSLGVLLYLVATQDRSAAEAWLSWIEANRPCLVTLPNGSCASYGAARYCTDEEHQSCTLTPGSWALMGRVWQALGLDRNSEMRRYSGVDASVLPLEAQHAPLGYETHLPAVEIYLKKKLADTSPWASVTDILAGRQPENPFFTYLHSGASPNLADQLLSICPQPGTDSKRHQWAWERSTADHAWENSMGWDCIFLANLL